jgi:hypothetical protein
MLWLPKVRSRTPQTRPCASRPTTPTAPRSLAPPLESELSRPLSLPSSAVALRITVTFSYDPHSRLAVPLRLVQSVLHSERFVTCCVTSIEGGPEIEP